MSPNTKPRKQQPPNTKKLWRGRIMRAKQSHLDRAGRFPWNTLHDADPRGYQVYFDWVLDWTQYLNSERNKLYGPGSTERAAELDTIFANRPKSNRPRKVDDDG